MTDIMRVLTGEGGYTIEVRNGEIYLTPTGK
jgi:hypothetical protein